MAMNKIKDCHIDDIRRKVQSGHLSRDELVSWIDNYIDDIVEDGKEGFDKESADRNQLKHDSTLVSTILFDRKDNNGNIYNGLPIDSSQKIMSTIINKEEIIIKASEVLLKITYPLTNSFEVNLLTKSENGFTRENLIREIIFYYKQVYNEEKYGFHSHNLTDLYLRAAYLFKDEDNKLYLELHVDS